MAEEEVKQEPVKPKKKMNLKIPIIIGGAILGIAVLFGAFFVFVKVALVPSIVSEVAQVQGQNVETEDKDGEKDGKKKDNKKHKDIEDMSPEEIEEAEFFTDDDDVKFMQTGRINTNPKASTQFVVVDLGLFFRERKHEGEEGEEAEEESSHGGEGEGEVDPATMKLMAKTRGIITQILGSYTVGELHANRAKLPEEFKNKLRPLYKQHDMFLKDVVLQEFIIQ